MWGGRCVLLTWQYTDRLRWLTLRPLSDRSTTCTGPGRDRPSSNMTRWGIKGLALVRAWREAADPVLVHCLGLDRQSVYICMEVLELHKAYAANQWLFLRL